MPTIPVQGLMKNAEHYYIYSLSSKLLQMELIMENYKGKKPGFKFVSDTC